MVDFTPIMEAQFFTMPSFSIAKFDLNAIVTIAPVALVLATEHIGHQIVTSKIVGRDLLKDPGLHRSVLADNFSTALSGMFGSVGTTTYGENIGVMAVTGVYSVQVIGGAAVLSILIAFIGPLSALIATIPGDVIGGITFLLYGMIGTSGLRILVDRKVDYSQSRNLVMTSVVFVAGLSGLTLQLGQVGISGMTLGALSGLFFGILFYIFDKLGIKS
jgi:uracil permease